MRIVTLVMTGLALLGGTGSAQTVTHDYDTGADFSSFETYAWARGTPLKNDEINHKRIVGAIDRQLTSKGLTKVEASANPDVLVAYHATFDRDLRITGFSSGWGGYRLGPNRSGSARVDKILNGTLAVDLVDTKKRAIVWRGIASKEVDVRASPEKREKNINKAAEKLFKNYPPKK